VEQEQLGERTNKHNDITGSERKQSECGGIAFVAECIPGRLLTP
jgi:hypothetical protein